MSDQRLQEAWSCFAQTEPGHVVERRNQLDDFLGLLLSSSRGEAPLSNLLHFSDLGSVVSLLGGQFLADIEHICLGSVSYDSDASSSATSRSVGSIVSDASRASDGSRGCRPRVTSTATAARSHRFTFPSHLPHLVQEHLLPDSDHIGENQEHSPEAQPSQDKDSKPWGCNSEKEGREIAGEESTLSGASSLQMKGTKKEAHSSNVTPTENGNDSGTDHGEENKSNSLSQSPCSEGTTQPPQDHGNQTPEPKKEATLVSIPHSPSQDKSSGAEQEGDDAPEAERDESLPVRCEGQGEEVLQSPKTQAEENQEASNSGNDSGQGKEAQNAATLTHYLQKGCGAKILVALDQLGVVGLTGGREISHVLAFIFTFMLKNSSLDSSAKRVSDRIDKGLQEAPLLSEKKDPDDPEAEKSTKSHLSFRFVPSVSLSLEDIFAPVIHLANSRSNSGGRSSSLSTPQPWMQSSVSKSSSVSSCQSLKKSGKKRRKKYSMSVPYVQSDSEGEENPKRSRLGKALVKFTMNPNDFDYFTRVVYSDDERRPDTDSIGSVVSQKDRVFISESIPSLSMVELLQCIISIQIQLAMHEAEQKHLSSPLLATHDILQFSLDTFTSMVSELKQKKENTGDLQLLLSWMLKLVFSSVQRFLKSSESLHNVTELGIIPKLLKLVCVLLDLKFDATISSDAQSDSAAISKDSESSQFDASKESLALEIIIGLLFLLQSCTCLKLEWKEVLECLHLHIVFLQNNGAEIIKKVVLHSKSLSLNKRAEILDSISHLVMYMKFWREDIYHSEKCDKKSHRFCEYRTVQNHHSRVFGINAENIKTIHPGRCMISNFSDILLDCFAGSKEAELSTCAIKSLSKCGLCCCMNSRGVLSRLLEDLPERIHHVVTFVTLFIENVVWRDLSGLAVTEPVKCTFCQKLKQSDLGSNLLSNDYASDESFMSSFVTKSKSPYHQFQAHDRDGAEAHVQYAVFWEGLSVYIRLLESTEISSKIINHIVRLVCQSNTDVKLALCDHLVVPALTQICNEGIMKYISREGHEKEILLNLIKCLRLTLAESGDGKLMEFLNAYGPGLIAECKEIQGIKHETFLLLCNTVKKELKMRPSLLVMGEMDEESEMAFAKLFEWEVIEQDEFWSAYFGMKAEEVRQKFFIRTQQSTDNSGDHSDVARYDRNKTECDSDNITIHENVAASCYSKSDSKEESVSSRKAENLMIESTEFGETIGDHSESSEEKECIEEQVEGETENVRYEESDKDLAGEHIDKAATGHQRDDERGDASGDETEETNEESISCEPEAEQRVGDEVLIRENGHMETEESITLQGPANESSSASESFPSERGNEGTIQPSSHYSMPRGRQEAADGLGKVKDKLSQLRESLAFTSQHSQESGWKPVSADTLIEKYIGLGELWAAVTEVLQTSTEFQVFLAGSAVRSLAAPMLVNITQDLARSSSGTVGMSSVVVGQLPVTFSLMQSLLTFIIVTYPYAGLHVETLLNELRSPLLHYSPSTCGDVKHLVSVMLQCCVFSSSPSLTYTLPHPPQHTVELMEEEPGPAGEGVDSQATEMDGYEADTEQLANTSPSSSKFLSEEDDLECPELVLLALDLIINHHEKYLESREEARQEAAVRCDGHQDTPTEPRDQQESRDQAASGTNAECEDQHLFEDQPEADRWVAGYPENGEHSRGVKGASGRWRAHRNGREVAPLGTKRNTATDAIKGIRKRSPGQNSSTADSISSTSSVYHTLNSDEETTSSLGEQASDWEDHAWLADHKLEGSRETVINKQSLQNSVPEGEAGSRPQKADTGSHHHFETNKKCRSPAEKQQGSGTSPVVSLCCESEAIHSASITQCIHALLLLCRSSATICRRLHALGLLSRLLDGFSDLICANDATYEDVVGTVVGVWAEVGRWCLAPTELSQFFTLFKSSSAPLEILLRALSRVLEGSGSEPQCALQYPCHVVTTSSTSPTFTASHNSLSESLASFVNIRAPASPMVEAITRLHESHCRHGILSCVSICCVACPVPRSLDWSPYNSGLACTTWLCVRDKSGLETKQQYSSQSSLVMSCRSEAFFDPGATRCSFSRGGATSTASVSSDLNPSKLHVLSVGTQHLMFSLWLDPAKDILQVCVSREVDRESSQLSQGVVMRAGLCDGAWHHLALCIPTINVRRGGNLKITIFVDSLTCHLVSVLVPAVGSIKKSSPSYLLLGHTDFFCEDMQPSCHIVDEFEAHGFSKPRRDSLPGSHHYQLLMGNTFLFREPILSRESCLYLIALGKDTTSLIPLTDKDERVVMPPFITPKLLSAGMDLSVLYGHMEVVVRPAQESILVLYTTQHPSDYLCYKPHVPSLQDTGNHYPLCSCQPAVLFGEVTPLQHRGPDLALLHMGGIAHIVFLFARLVELGSDEREQAAALRLLTHCIHSSPQLAAQYEGVRGSSLVFRILRSPLSCPGVQVMKALLDGCTSPSVVQYIACRDVYTVGGHVPALLTDRALLSSILTNWRTFLENFSKDQSTKYCVNEKGERMTVIGIILSVLKVLLAENQPYRDFNIAQLRDIDALDKILFMCKELELTTGSLDSICSANLVVAVVAGLVGASSSPPWRNSPSVAALALAAQESYSSGFSSRTSGAGLPVNVNPLGLTSYGLGSPSVRVRDVAAVYGFLLLVHPAHLTYAATERHTAYYLPHIPVNLTSSSKRNGSSVAVGVDLAAELMDRPEKPQILQQFQAGEWQVIENSDPLMQLKRIRQQQQAEIRKLRREGSIARSAYYSSEDEDSSGEGHSSSTDKKDSSVFNSEDQVDSAALQRRPIIPHVVVSPGKGEEHAARSPERKSERDTPENLSATEDDVIENDRETSHSEDEQPPNNEQAGESNALPRITKWAEDPGETEEEDSGDEEESTATASLSCLTRVVVGLLETLEEVLRCASDTAARTLLAEAMHMDQTLIMANHPHPVIRQAVLKLFTTMMDRCSPEDNVLHLRQNVPLIMGQQLHKHATSISSQLVMAAFSLALSRSFTFEDYAVDCDPSLALQHKVVLFIPLLALLPNSAQDIALCHNTLMVLLDLLHKNTELIIPLIHKAYFVDSLLCTLKSSLHTEGVGVSDLTGESECEVVVSDITEILSWIVNCLVASTQHKNFLLSLEVLHHLNLLCRGESAVCGGQASCVGHLQGTEAALLQVALSRIQATASTHQHALTCDAAAAAAGPFKLEKTSMTGSSSLHNMKLASPGTPREESDSGVGSVLANYTTIPFTKSLHNISDQLFLSQSRSSPALGSEGSRKDDKVLAHSELVDRFKVLIQKATDFLFMSAWSSVESVACALPSASASENFSLFLLELLLSAAATITQRKGNSERCGWERVLWGCQDTLRLHLNHLLALVTSPRTHLQTRVRAAQALSKHPRLHAIINCTAKANPQLMYKVGIFIHELRYQNESRLDAPATRCCESLLQVLEECSVQVLPPPETFPPHGAMREWSVVTEEKKHWQDESAKIAILVVDRCTKQDERLMTKNTQVYEAVAQECSRLTRSVVDRQNVERKLVLGGIKHTQCHHVHLTHRWRDLLETLTHERATWHFQHSYPRSWQLDQTEGPLRIRKRLSRGRLLIHSRYLVPEYRQKIVKNFNCRD
ncbi:lysosomal-trafficking regulator-like isoform X2 [Scylla paramamosain]|uniref:lysosomal-trafficking regulator-like isoform X2 n=1 Tax=Scylla paramamosain TaxID=85552 RepID=UPI0030838FF5